MLSWVPDAKWMVCEVDADSIVSLGTKVKFPKCSVVHCGDRLSATAYLAKRTPGSKSIVGVTATAGYRGTATAGYRGTATAGYRGQLLINWWDGNRYRKAIGYTGENGIKAKTKYRCDEKGNLVEVK